MEDLGNRRNWVQGLWELSVICSCLRQKLSEKNWKGVRLPKKIRLGSLTKVWEHFLLEEEKTYSVLIG